MLLLCLLSRKRAGTMGKRQAKPDAEPKHMLFVSDNKPTLQSVRLEATSGLHEHK